MANKANRYIGGGAEKELNEADQAAFGPEKNASAVSNDILRTMLSSEAQEGEEDLFPSELPQEVFAAVHATSLALDAFVDQIKDRTNEKAPAVETAMLDLVALEMDRNALLITGTFETAEELVEETPAGWKAAQRYASADQKKELGDVGAKTAALRKMLHGSAGFIREAVRVPEGPELFEPGETVSEAVDGARPVLRKHIELASTYGPDSTAEELSAALANPNVAGAEPYHVERMIDAGVSHDVLVKVMGEAGMSFADFPNLAIEHFVHQEASDETAIVPLLRQMKVGDTDADYASKIVDLHAFEDPDKFMAQLSIVRSYNALVEFQEARKVVDPADGKDPSRLATEADIAALTEKPKEAQGAYDLAISFGLGEWLSADAGSADVVELVKEHGRFTDDAEIQGDMTHELVFGAAPGEESGAVLMDSAEKAAKKALDADAEVRAKAEALGMKMPGVPATDRLKAWYEVSKSLKSSKDKIGAVWDEGLGGARGYDAVQASVGVAKAVAGVVKETAAAAGDAYEGHAADLKSRLPTPHAHDLIKKGAAVEMPDPTTPEIDGLMGQSQAFKSVASAAEGVALIGDVIGLADGFKKIAEGDVGAGALDLAGGTIGIIGSVAARRVAAQGLASGMTFNIAQAAGPVGYLVAYFQLIHSAFAKMEAAEKAFVAKRGVQLFGGVTHQAKRGGEAARKAAAIMRMAEVDTDPNREASFARELERETKVAAEVVNASHEGVLGVLAPDKGHSHGSEIYGEWVDWPEQRAAFQKDYEKDTKGAPGSLSAASTSGSFETFHKGSSTVFSGMGDLADQLEKFVKKQAD